MKKEDRLSVCRTQLLRLAAFLENYLPLANAHTVDFLVENMWEAKVPEVVRNELLSLNYEGLVGLPERLPENFIEDNGEEDQCNVTDEPPCEGASDIESAYLRSSEEVKGRQKLNKQQKCVWKHRGLKQFVKNAHFHTLKGLNVLSSKDTWLTEESRSFHMQNFMCAKKAHEVEVMANVCSSLCKKHNIDQVVDIGSGLGYLSGHLAFLHNLKVLGIDSSNTNTHGADKRSTRLAKHWPLLLANAQLTHLGLPPARTKGKKKQKYLQKIQEHGASDSSESINPDDYIPPEKYAALATKLSAAKQLSPKGQFRPVTMYITKDTKLCDLIDTHFKDPFIPQILSTDNGINDSDNTCAGSDISLTGNSDNRDCETTGADSSLLKSGGLTAASDVGTAECNERTWALTGLHTCGGLASSVLKLFITNPSAACVCNVGCCYHLLDEEFIQSPFEKDGDPEPTEFGFPLSKWLLEQRFYLGRNARMLACQAAARLSSASDSTDRVVPERSLHWRAVLQVILRDVMKEVREDWNVGKIASKSSSFTEYVMKAFQKLGLSHQLTDAEIDEYEKKFEHAERYMKCFFYLRATLSQCIESIILLDRLVFLLEQECVSEACLVELFDPKTSPRCWALIASK